MTLKQRRFIRKGISAAGFLVGFLLGTGSVTASVPVEISHDSGPIPLSAHLWFARDSTGKAGIEDRNEWDWFAVGADAGIPPTFGYTADAVWVRVDIANRSAEDVNAVVELAVARMEEFSGYVLDDDRVLYTVSAGLNAVSAGGCHAARYPLIIFSVPAGSMRTVYMRVRSASSLRFPVTLAPVACYVRYAARRDLGDYGFAGTGVAVVLLALLNAWVQRDRLFLILAALVGAFLGYYMVFHGYYVWAGGPLQNWVNRNLLLAFSMGGHGAFLAFTLEFARRGVEGKRLFPFAKWWGRFVWAGVPALCVLPFRAGVYFLFIALCVTYGVGAYIALRLVRRAPAWSSRVLAAVWGMAVLVVLLMFARFFAWFPLALDIMLLQRSLMISIFLAFFAIVIAQQRSVRRQAERAQRAEQLATEAQLRALRYQLNPHFLFNTLTSVDALSRKAPGRIPPLVRKLAAYLRLRLQPASDGMTDFATEWEAVRAYLDIEQVRFGDALRVRYEVSDAVLTGRVPEMLVQPLAENAVKHGMPEQGFLDICFCARRKGETLHIRVENSIRSQRDDPPSPTGGLGLRNVKERLRYIYGDTARFDFREEDGTSIAEIVMPFEEAHL